MKSGKFSGTLGLLALAVLAVPFASAQDTGLYIGGNIGRSKATIDDERITGGLRAGGLATTSIIDRDKDTGFKLYGGYQFNRNFALEGGYFDLGKFGFTANTLPAGTLDGTIRLKGINLDAVGILPITEKFSALGRVGLNYASAKDSFVGTGSVRVLNPNPSKRDTNYKLGVGLQYAITDALKVRAELERYRINDAIGNKGDIDLVSVGLVYAFGAKPQPPRAMVAEPVAAAPQPVAVTPPPPPPPPQPAPPPPPPRVPTKVTFSADSLFDFNKATMKPGGTQALDKFSSDLKGVQYDGIRVTGYTDRIGSKPYNLKLSTRRAEAVTAYLVGSAGIPAGKITTRGVNGADPVTKPGDCKGNKASKKLIACLQPDRRVEVEVSGTK